MKRILPAMKNFAKPLGWACLLVVVVLFAACTDYETEFEDEFVYLLGTDEEWEDYASSDDHDDWDDEYSSSEDEEDRSSDDDSSSSSDVIASSSSATQSSSSVAESGSSAGKEAWKYLNPDIDYGEMTDERDGQVYKTVKIGNQTWMAENLNYAPSDVSSMGENAWSGCYGDDVGNCDKYGRLYTWEVANNVCPEGWHLPNQDEFDMLIRYIDGSYVMESTDYRYSTTAGAHLKAEAGWKNSGNGDDIYGYSALPAGGRYSGEAFYNDGTNAGFWSSSEKSIDTAYGMIMYNYDDNALMYYFGKYIAYSVRCVQNPYIDYGKFTDERDGQEYKTVEIGSQTWMAENLNYAYNEPTSSLDSSSFCYNNEIDSCTKYGRLYLWSAAMDSAGVFSSSGIECGYGKTCSAGRTVRGVCPEGWHLPNTLEWENLLIYAFDGGNGRGDGLTGVGISLKSTSGWLDNNGVDIYGFSALPAGWAGSTSNNYGYVEKYAEFWSSEERGDYVSYRMNLNYNDQDAILASTTKTYAYSVRCLKDY